MSKLKKSEYPKYLQGYHKLKSVYIGGCPLYYCKLQEDKTVLAHAHSLCGIISFRTKRNAKSKIIGLHELAHVLVGPGIGHRDRWRNMLHSIAGPLAEKELALYPKIKRRKANR